MRFWIDIENATGDKQGSGPISSALNWRSVKRLDRAGEFSFEVPATDSTAALVKSRHVARCYAIVDGAVMEIGAGMVDSISVRVPTDGQPLLVVSGPDLLGELRRVVLDQRGSNTRTSHASGEWVLFQNVREAPFLIIRDHVNAKFLGGEGGQPQWAVGDEEGTVPSSPHYITDLPCYLKFRHETALAGLLEIAQATGGHFRLGTGRKVEWVNTWEDSGFHAVHGAPNPVAVEEKTEIALIAKIEKITDSQDIVNRVFLYGSGEGHARLDLLSATEWPDGTAISGTSPFYNAWTSQVDGGHSLYLAKDITTVSLDYCFNCLQENGSRDDYGNNEIALTFKHITPVSNTADDVELAANQLLRSGYEWMRMRSIPQDFYRLTLWGVQGEVKVGEKLQVTARRYVDGHAAIDVDQPLYVLESTTEVAIDGLRTMELVVSTTERQLIDDNDVIVGILAGQEVSQTHQQPAASGWTEEHIDEMDEDFKAEFRFILGEEIVQIQQILLRFRVDTYRWTESDGIHEITAQNLTYGHPTDETGATVAQIGTDIDIMVGGADKSADIEAGLDGWFDLDLTTYLVAEATRRPSDRENVIYFEHAAGTPTGHTARITFKLQVRCSMQSVDYS